MFWINNHIANLPAYLWQIGNKILTDKHKYRNRQTNRETQTDRQELCTSAAEAHLIFRRRKEGVKEQ